MQTTGAARRDLSARDPMPDGTPAMQARLRALRPRFAQVAQAFARMESPRALALVAALLALALEESFPPGGGGGCHLAHGRKGHRSLLFVVSCAPSFWMRSFIRSAYPLGSGISCACLRDLLVSLLLSKKRVRWDLRSTLGPGCAARNRSQCTGGADFINLRSARRWAVSARARPATSEHNWRVRPWQPPGEANTLEGPQRAIASQDAECKREGGSQQCRQHDECLATASVEGPQVYVGAEAEARRPRGNRP